jgi:hypothetical protein
MYNSSVSNAIENYFAGKPHTYEIFKELQRQIRAQGDSEVHVASQISFGGKRKFAWIWLYNITGAHPEGTVQIMLALDRKVDEPPIYRVTQIGSRRWNHLAVVHSMDEAQDPKLYALIEEAYRYGTK